ncbi:MAG: protein kinase [Planctomycetota bacterium JB042]
MNGGDLGRALRIVEEALDLEGEERAAHVRKACGGDPALEAEVRALLEEDDDGAFLAPPLAASASVDLAERFVGRRLGEFTIDGVVAGGGMGTVFRATQDHPQRVVALKVLRPTIASATAVERFREEVEILGRLDHPGIARIHDAGTTREAGLEVPWFAMEFVDGARDVLRYASDERLDARARIELFREILAAVRHGHQRGIIHRDLKPSNLLVDRAGRPRVIDFGVARAVDGERDVLRTATGELIGTLKYMSPEQFAADAADVDTRTDVFSLGVVLYELLVGAAPFDLTGKSVVEIALAVRDGRMRPPREVLPSLPEDLDWIIRRALDPERERRYENAGALADDLGRWLRDEPVAAGPPTASYRLRKFVRRHLIGLALAALVLVLVAAGVFGTVVNWRVAVRERAEAEEESRWAKEATRFFAEMLQTADPWTEEPDLRVTDLLDRAAAQVGERFAGAPEHELTLRGVLGTTYLNLARPAAAVEQLRAAIDAARRLAAEEGEPLGPTELLLRRRLAVGLGQLGRTDEAVRWAEELVETAERRPEVDDEERVRCRVELVEQLRNAERAEEALEALAPLVPRLEDEAVPGALRRLIGDSLSLVLLDLGRAAEALDVVDDAIGLAIGAADEDQNLASLLRRRSRALRILGLFPESAEELRRAAAILERRLGPGHRRTLSARSDLAEIELDAEDYRAAEATLRDVIARKETLPEFEPSMLAADREKLGRALLRTGRPAEARALFEQALAAVRRQGETFGIEFLETRARIGGLLFAAGDREAGLRELEGAIDRICVDWRPSYATAVEFVRHSISAHVTDEARATELLTLLAAVTEGREGVDAQGHALIHVSLAQSLRRRIRLAAALDHLDEALRRLSPLGAEAEPIELRARLERATLLNLVGEPDAAEREVEAMLRSRTAGDEFLSRAQYGLAFLHSEQGRAAEAERAYRALLEYDLGEESFTGAVARIHLARLLARRGADDEAAATFREAAEMVRRTDARQWGLAVDGEARALLNLGREDEARRVLLEFEAESPRDRCSPALHTLFSLSVATGADEAARRLAARIEPAH